MYRMHVTVVEYVGAYGVFASLSDKDETGRVHLVAQAKERIFDPSSPREDPFLECLEVLARWTQIEPRSGRVDAGGLLKTAAEWDGGRWGGRD